MSSLRSGIALGIVLLLLSVNGQSAKPGSRDKEGGEKAAPVSVETDAGTLRVTGPYTHNNLAVFLLHSEKQDEREFLTLDQGLKDGVVKITELDQESVGRLKFTNESTRPLYLQEGERLQGGKQDRTIAASLVLPPRSAPTEVPTFCIEQSRWKEGASGRKFGFAVNPALAPKGVRGAAKFESSQERVWSIVQVQKDTGKKEGLATSTTSSANELFDAPRVQKISEEYALKLAGALRDQRDAVGVVLVVNGKIEEVDVYPNRALLGKLYPRLVQSYAVQAEMLKEKAAEAKPLTAMAVAAFIKQGKELSSQTQKLIGSNEAVIRQFEGNKLQCTAKYEGKTIHLLMMQKNATGTSADARYRAGRIGFGY